MGNDVVCCTYALSQFGKDGQILSKSGSTVQIYTPVLALPSIYHSVYVPDCVYYLDSGKF